MRYLGSKQRLARRLFEQMSGDLSGAETYVEPFVGGLGMAAHVAGRFEGRMLLSDSNAALISLFEQWGEGWRPAEHVTREEYEAVRAAKDPADPRTALLGFGMSYGGKWFGGYIGELSAGRDYWAELKRGMDKKMSPILSRAAEFRAGSYLDAEVPDGAVVYCDPPYASTTGYDAVSPFCHETFWRWARETSKRAVVYVSEYSAPSDIPVLWEGGHSMQLNDNKNKAVERLYRLAPEQEDTNT